MRTTQECIAKAAEAAALAERYSPDERTHANLLVVARTWLEQGRRTQGAGPGSRPKPSDVQ